MSEERNYDEETRLRMLQLAEMKFDGITDEERIQLWKELDYNESNFGKEFDLILEQRIRTLSGITEFERVEELGGNGYLPVSWLNVRIEKVKSAKAVLPRWNRSLRGIKASLVHPHKAKMSIKRLNKVLFYVVIGILEKELCMMIIEEDPAREYPLMDFIEDYVKKL